MRKSGRINGAMLEQMLDAVFSAEVLAGTGSPRGISEAVARLELAVSACAEFQNEAPRLPVGASCEAKRAVREVRAALGGLNALLDSASTFHTGWARIAGMRMSTYGPGGLGSEPAQQPGIGSRFNASG